MASTKKKRKRVVLTIEEKMKVLDMLDKSVSYTVIAEKFGIGKSTVSDLKKNKEKIRSFQREMIDMGKKLIWTSVCLPIAYRFTCVYFVK